MANGHTANPHHTFYVEGSGYYNLQGGGIRVYDSLNSSALEIKHQSAAIIDLTGIGSTTNIYTNCSLAMRSGAGVYTYDAGNTKYARMLHNGTEGYLDTNSGSFYIAPASGITYFFTSGTQAKIRAYNSGGTAYGDFYYDGTYLYLDHSTGSGLNTLSLSLTTNNDTADEPGYKGVPQLAKTTSYPLVLADAGKCVYLTGSTASQTVTIPANASVAFPIGTVIEIISDSTVNWSIAITTDTLEQLGTGATGTRTLAPDGKAVLEKVTATKWKISGINLG